MRKEEDLHPIAAHENSHHGERSHKERTQWRCLKVSNKGGVPKWKMREGASSKTGLGEVYRVCAAAYRPVPGDGARVEAHSRTVDVPATTTLATTASESSGGGERDVHDTK